MKALPQECFEILREQCVADAHGCLQNSPRESRAFEIPRKQCLADALTSAESLLLLSNSVNIITLVEPLLLLPLYRLISMLKLEKYTVFWM